MDFDHIHFQVDDIERWRKWFADTLQFQTKNTFLVERGLSSTVEMTTPEGVQIRLSSLSSSGSSVPSTGSQGNGSHGSGRPRSEGVKDVAFRVAHLEQAIARVLDAGGMLLSGVRSHSTQSGIQKQATVLGWGGLHHTLVERSDVDPSDHSLEPTPSAHSSFQSRFPSRLPPSSVPKALFPNCESSGLASAQSPIEPHAEATAGTSGSTLVRSHHQTSVLELASLVSAIDHVVLNVPVGEMEPAVDWYTQAFGLERQQRFSIQTDRSALHSQVLRHPDGNVQFPINEPASPHSQIQEFLDAYGGAGIQHIALRTEHILEAIAHMRSRGVAFLDVPHTYYEQLQQRSEFSPDLADFEAIARLKILVDWPTHTSDAMLLQTFTQPIFGQPTFFFEVIQRQLCPTPQGYRRVQGFGEGNFQALFEAVEREQMKRGEL